MPEPIQHLIYEEKPPAYSTVRDYVSVVLRHKGKAFLFFLLSLTVSVSVVIFLKESYQSEAKLLVRPGWESMNVDPTAATSENAGMANQSQTVLLNTMLDIIQSKALAEDVVDAIGVGAFISETAEAGDAGMDSSITQWKDQATKAVKDALGMDAHQVFSDRDKAVKVLMENTTADVLRNTQIISIAFASPDPALAQRVVHELTDLCLNKHKLVYRNPLSYPFLEEQEKESSLELDRLRTEFRDLKQEAGLTSVQNRLNFMENNIGRLEQEIGQTEVDLHASAAKLENLAGKLTTLPQTHRTGETNSLDFSVINSLRERLQEQQNERNSLLTRFTEDSDVVKEKNRLIAEIEETLRNEKPREVKTETWALSSTYIEVETALRMEETAMESYKAKSGELKLQLAEAKKEREGLIALELRYNKLEGELQNREAQHAKIVAKVGQARMEQTLEEKRISNISEIQAATLPMEPEKSRKLIILIAGFIGGILGGIVLTFIIDLLDRTLKTPEQVENKLELPALVCIPRLSRRLLSIKKSM
ncbi:MAG: hypothetical protein ABIK28_03915 [Planctomycetota bacterium]